MKLWRAVAMIAQDKPFREAVRALAKEVPFPEYPAGQTVSLPGGRNVEFQDWRPQPDPAAIAAIDDLFRERGLHMTIYDLAEMNRWMARDTDGTKALRLDSLWDLLKPIARMVPDGQMASFHEVVGALISDERFRLNSAVQKPSTRGFILTPDVESALMTLVATANFKDLAKQWVLENWDGSACLTSLDNYPEYVHPNM